MRFLAGFTRPTELHSGVGRVERGATRRHKGRAERPSQLGVDQGTGPEQDQGGAHGQRHQEQRQLGTREPLGLGSECCPEDEPRHAETP